MTRAELLTVTVADVALLALMLLAGLIVMTTLFVMYKRMQKQRNQQQLALQSAQNDLRALCNAAVTMGRQVKRLQKRLESVSLQQNELDARQIQIDQADPDEQSYQHAIKLAQKGANTEDLIEVCGLSRGEADLINMMHRLEKVG